ncbi:MAG: hypothetical protein NXH73_01680 [Flavobacteriaceae bacterium]|nr:hypothetical protein [Flavobacteriaceae bacterium]
MKQVLTIVLLFTTLTVFSQVGINTTTPSDASVIDVHSTSDGIHFGGMLPPRVTLAERDLIPVTAADEGMLVYVLNPPNSQLQIWDGTAWQTLFPQSIEFSAVLAAWDVLGVGGFGPSPFNASESSASVTVGGLTRGSGLTTSGGGSANSWGADGWESGLPNESQANSIATGKFVTFTVMPNFGVNVSLTTIEHYNIRRSGTGPTTGIWQYSINGTDFSDIGAPIIWGGDTSATGNPQAAIDLSGIADLQNLTSTTTVTFRIVNWDASGAGGTWYINNINGNDLIVRGNLR